MIGRRALLAASPASLCLFALADLTSAAVRLDRRLPVRRWLRLQNELARALEAGAMSQLQWHDAVNALSGELDLGEMAAAIRKAELVGDGAYDGHDPVKRFVRFKGADGKPAWFAYGLALFSFGPGDVITPHGHEHMVSAHMVLEGRVRVRTFDRLGETPDALILTPSADELAEPGWTAAISGTKDNVHWFAPRSPKAMTLDVIVDGLDPGRDRYTIQPVDVMAAPARADGVIEAPLMSFEASSAKYKASL